MGGGGGGNAASIALGRERIADSSVTTCMARWNGTSIVLGEQRGRQQERERKEFKTVVYRVLFCTEI